MTSTITQLLTSAVQSQSSSMPCAASSRSDTAVFLETTASLQNRGKPFIRVDVFLAAPAPYDAVVAQADAPHLPQRGLALDDHHLLQTLAVPAVQLVLHAVGGGGVLRRGTEQVKHLIVVREAVDEVDDGIDVR